MNDTTRTRVTRPDLSSVKDAPESEVETSTEEKSEEPAPEPTAAPRHRSKPQVRDAFTAPFSVNGATVTDAAGLVVCRAGGDHLSVDQRTKIAEWIAETLSA